MLQKQPRSWGTFIIFELRFEITNSVAVQRCVNNAIDDDDYDDGDDDDDDDDDDDNDDDCAAWMDCWSMIECTFVF